MPASSGHTRYLFCATFSCKPLFRQTEVLPGQPGAGFVFLLTGSGPVPSACRKSGLQEKVAQTKRQREKMDGTGIEAFYAKFGDKLPAEMRHQLDALKARLA